MAAQFQAQVLDFSWLSFAGSVDDDDFRDVLSSEKSKIAVAGTPLAPVDAEVVIAVSGFSVENAVRLVHVDQRVGGQTPAGVVDPPAEGSQLLQRQWAAIDAHRAADHLLLREIVSASDFDDEFPDARRRFDQILVEIHDKAFPVVEIFDGGFLDGEGVDYARTLPVADLRYFNQLCVIRRKMNRLLEQPHSFAFHVGCTADATTSPRAVGLMP